MAANVRAPVLSRRQFVESVAGLIAGGMTLAGCESRDDGTSSYCELATETWRGRSVNAARHADIARELVRYATLAANSHNSQPWLFQIDENGITILPDHRRRLPVVDPDDHHLYVSLGCATENLVQAARSLGFATNVVVTDGQESAAIRIELEPASPTKSVEFLAIPYRQCTRADYRRNTVSVAELRKLECSAGSDPVTLRILTSSEALEQVAEYVVAGNSVQMNDAAFIRELRGWMRFNAVAAAVTRDGLYSAASGHPELPDWLGSLMFRLAYRADAENKKHTKQVRQSAGIAIIASCKGGRSGWIASGRCCQRFALQATALGLKCAFVNQPVEVSSVRAQFVSYLGMTGLRPDLVMRFGHGPTLPRSLRRPVDAVMTTQGMPL